MAGSRNRFIKRKPKKKVKPARSRAENRRSVTKAKPKLGPIPASKRPKDMQAGKVYGDAGQPKAPKLPPKPTKAAPKAAPKAASKSAPKAATKAKSSGKKLTPMQQWAKANPGLAKKLKKGQSGYKEIKNGRSSKPRNWLAKNYKPNKK